MFTSTYEISTHHIVLMSWVEFVISTCITSDKLFHYWHFYFFTVVLHSETVRGTKFHKMPIPTKYFNNVRKTCAGSVSLHGLYMVHTSSRWLTLMMPFLAVNYLAVGWRCTLISVKIYDSQLFERGLSEQLKTYLLSDVVGQYHQNKSFSSTPCLTSTGQQPNMLSLSQWCST